MIARASDTPYDFKPEHSSLAPDTTSDTPDTPVEKARPAEESCQQTNQCALPPGRLTLIGGGIAAACLGGAIGYWLGRRHAPRQQRALERIAAHLESAAGIAPLAMHLLTNPLIRALAMRVIVRQLGKRIEQ